MSGRLSIWNVGDLILDLYRVDHVHTGGNMGLVYRARHLGWDMDLAVKSPRPELFRTANQRTLFARECKIWTELGLHPNIVNCYYVRAIEGIPHVFAEYVDGGTLADWIDDKRLYNGSPEDVCFRIIDIAIQFAWGLQYAHGRGVVHRDVKPNNVLMTPSGTAKVSDFGIAKAMQTIDTLRPAAPGAQSPTRTLAGMTRSYRSPEQAAGLNLSIKTDVWSWAVSTLEMFCGGVLWGDGQIADETFKQVVRGRMRIDHAPTMPHAVVQVLDRCLQRDVERRPGSMFELVRELIKIYEVGTGTRYPRKELRDRASGEASIDADLIPTIIKHGSNFGIETSADTSNRALSLLDLGDPVEAAHALKSWLAEHPRDPVPWCNEGLLRIGLGEASGVQVAREFTEYVAPRRPRWRELGVDADRFLAFVSSHFVVRHSSPVVGVSWLPEVSQIVSSAADGTILYWNVGAKGLEVTREIHVGMSKISGTWITGDGWLFVGSENGRLELRRSCDGSLVRSIQIEPEYIPPSRILYGTTRPIFNSVRGVVHAANTDGVMVYLENADNFELSFPDLGKRAEWHERRDSNFVAASPLDGRFVLLGEPQGRIWLYLKGRQKPARLMYNAHEVKRVNTITRMREAGVFERMVELTGLACSPDGLWIASTSRSGGLLIWSTDEVLAATEDSPCLPSKVLSFEDEPTKTPCFSAASDRLFFTDGKNVVRSLDVVTMEHVELMRPDEEITVLSPSIDGSSLALGCRSGAVLKQPLVKPNWTELPFLICRPSSAEDVREHQSEIDTILDQASSEFAAGHYAECAVYAERGLRLASDDEILASKFHDLQIQLPASRTSVRRTELKWCVSHIGKHAVKSTPGGVADAIPFTHSIALAPEGVVAIATDVGIRWLTLSDGRELNWVDVLQVHSITFDAEIQRWLVCTLFGAVGAVPSAGIGELYRTPGVEMLNSIVPLRNSRRGVAACVSGDGRLLLWNGETRFEILRAMSHSIEVVAVSPDSSWLALAGLDGDIGCIDLEDLKPITALVGHSAGVRCIAFNPDGTLLASSSDDGTVRLWVIQRGEAVHVFSGHDCRVHAVAFTPNGDWLASADESGAVRLWSTVDDQTYVLKTPHGEIAALSFDAGAGFLVTAHRHGTVCKWAIHWELDMSAQGQSRHHDQIRRRSVAQQRSPRPRVT
jgi:WD40 repeat protein/serine/threonine protein kinase